MAVDSLSTALIFAFFVMFIYWVSLGGPIPRFRIVRKKIDLSKLSDKELRAAVPYEKYCVVNTTKAYERMLTEFKSLVGFFKDEYKNLDLRSQFFLTAIIKAEDMELTAIGEKCVYYNQNLKELEKYLKDHTYNQTVIDLFRPKRSYYLIKVLQATRDAFKNKEQIPLSAPALDKIGDELNEWFTKIEEAPKDTAAVSESK